jgi:apolipoprotein N-acyltransferase
MDAGVRRNRRQGGRHVTVVEARPASDDPPVQVPRSWLHRLRPVLLAAAAGVALLVSFPPYDLWWLAPVGVAALALACHGRRLRTGALLGFLCGAIYLGVMLKWTGTQVGPMPWLLLSALQASYLAVMGAASAWVSPLLVRRPVLWGPVVGALWVGQEALRDRVPFGGFPWARLAFSQGDSPLLGLAALGGAPLVSFATAVAGGLLLHAGMTAVTVIRGTPPARLFARPAAIVGVAALVLVSGLFVPLHEPGGRTVTVAVVQGNVPRLGLEFNAQRRAVLDNHVDGTLRLADDVAAGRQKQPDLVVWPENSSDIDPLRNPDAAARISAAADAIKAPILVGALNRAGANNVLNVGLVWHPGTGAGERYVKQHPVPFAEYVPFRSLARKVTTKVDLVRSDFVGGDRPGVLQMGPARIGDVICFEVAYDGIVRDTVLAGGQILAVQTNNATFDVAEAEQQLAMVRLRAVEHGRHALMASTVGVSGFVDAHGRVYGATSFFTPAVIVRELRIDDGRTLATRLGALPEYLIILGALAGLVAAALIRRATKTTKTTTKEDL